MKNKFIIWSIIFSLVGLINVAIYICLVHFKILEVELARYILNAVYFVLIWLPIFLKFVCKIKFSLYTLIVFDFFIICSVLVGSAYNVYDRLPLYDKIVHFGSGIIVSLIFYDIFSQNSKDKLSGVWLFLFALSIAMLVGGVWEIYEFSYDSIAGANSQKWIGQTGHSVLNDSMYDLICDFTGGIVGSIIAVIINNKESAKK